MQFSALRSEQGRTISWVAQQSGLSPITARSVEAGTGTIKSMMAMLAVLDATINWRNKSENDLGRALSSERQARGISQRTMAAMLSVSQPTIIALEARSTGRMQTFNRYVETLGLRISLVPRVQITKPKLVPKKNLSEADKVFTPRQLAAQIIDQLPLAGNVLDPCRGDGAFYDQLASNVLKHWCELDDGRDFFEWDRHVDWVISNPPWSKFRQFLQHGMTVADNVVYLAAFTHFSTKARVGDIKAHGFAMRSIIYVPTPKEWPQSGFQMAAVWLQRGWCGPCEVTHI